MTNQLTFINMQVITRYLLQKLFGPMAGGVTTDHVILYLDLPANMVSLSLSLSLTLTRAHTHTQAKLITYRDCVLGKKWYVIEGNSMKCQNLGWVFLDKRTEKQAY